MKGVGDSVAIRVLCVGTELMSRQELVEVLWSSPSPWRTRSSWVTGTLGDLPTCAELHEPSLDFKGQLLPASFSPCCRAALLPFQMGNFQIAIYR